MSKAKQASRDEQRQFWRMVFQTHQASGLTIKQFCKNEGISEAAFYSWRKKLAAHDEPPKHDGPSAVSREFIEVHLPARPAGLPVRQTGGLNPSPAVLELVFASGHALRIPAGADPAFLGHVLSALKQVDLC